MDMTPEGEQAVTEVRPPAQDLRAAAQEQYPELRAPMFPERLSAAQLEAQKRADKAAADAVLAAAGGMTLEDLAELRVLRRERAEREHREAQDRAEAEARLTAPSHHVHLADGTVVDGSAIGTHHSFGDGSGHARGDRVLAVAGAYRKE